MRFLASEIGNDGGGTGEHAETGSYSREELAVGGYSIDAARSGRGRSLAVYVKFPMVGRGGRRRSRSPSKFVFGRRSWKKVVFCCRRGTNICVRRKLGRAVPSSTKLPHRRYWRACFADGSPGPSISPHLIGAISLDFSLLLSRAVCLSLALSRCPVWSWRLRNRE